MPPSPLADDAFAAMLAQPNAADIPRLVEECRRLRKRVEQLETDVEGCARAERRALAATEALELDVERAHRYLDDFGLPRERRDGDRPLELSLLGRLQSALEDE